jgi:hypothetical protein
LGDVDVVVLIRAFSFHGFHPSLCLSQSMFPAS